MTTHRPLAFADGGPAKDLLARKHVIGWFEMWRGSPILHAGHNMNFKSECATTTIEFNPLYRNQFKTSGSS
jgi:hypothetical protein